MYLRHFKSGSIASIEPYYSCRWWVRYCVEYFYGSKRPNVAFKSCRRGSGAHLSFKATLDLRVENVVF